MCFSLLVWSYPIETFLCVLYVYSKKFIHICGNLIFLAMWYELPNDFGNSRKSNFVKSLMVIEVEDYQGRCLLDVCFTLQLLLPNINSFCKFLVPYIQHCHLYWRGLHSLTVLRGLKIEIVIACIKNSWKILVRTWLV